MLFGLMAPIDTRLMKSEQRCYVIVSQKGSTEHDISDVT